MSDIVVVGSINMDMVVRAPRMPKPGETITGSDFQLIPGGKGANQAVAASRLGGETLMIGRVGDDPFGEVAIESLSSSGVDVDGIELDFDSPTGTASIIVDDNGENRIIVIPGANGQVTMEMLTPKLSELSNAQLLVLQFEIPMETNLRLMEFAAEHEVKVMLNPAPAAEIAVDLFPKVDILVVNETEAEMFTGMQVAEVETALSAADILHKRGVGTVIVTLGSKGAVLKSEDVRLYVPAMAVDVVDTTAAGDTFVGGFAASLVSGKSMEDALAFAVCASSLAVTRLGAQPSIPDSKAIIPYLDKINVIRYE